VFEECVKIYKIATSATYLGQCARDREGDFVHEFKYKLGGVESDPPPLYCKADARYAHILAVLHSEDKNLAEYVLYFSGDDYELVKVDLKSFSPDEYELPLWMEVNNMLQDYVVPRTNV
jgi:hypothetical protein